MRSFLSDIPWRMQGLELLRLSAPIVGTALIQQFGNFFTMSLVGTHVEGSAHMGAVALGGMLCNISGL
jgi:Na+-driven multidrug efflux pump